MIAIDPAKLAEIADRWSDLSPDDGTEQCICMVCAKMIGAAENDPRWEDHDEDCIGCELCEIAVRLWNEQPTPQVSYTGKTADSIAKELKEMRFHPKCFEGLLK